jgi:hypothetical protein
MENIVAFPKPDVSKKVNEETTDNRSAVEKLAQWNEDEKKRNYLSILKIYQSTVEKKKTLSMSEGYYRFLNALEAYCQSIINHAVGGEDLPLFIMLSHLDNIPGIEIVLNSDGKPEIINKTKNIPEESIKTLSLFIDYFMQLSFVKKQLGIDLITSEEVLSKTNIG